MPRCARSSRNTRAAVVSNRCRRLSGLPSAKVVAVADQKDLDFTYSLTDRVFRLSMGELAGLQRRQVRRRLLDEPGARPSAESTSTWPSRSGSGRAGACSTSAAAGGRCSTSSAAGTRIGRRRHPVPGAAAACRRHGLDVHLYDARQLDRETLRPVRRRREPRRLRALLLGRGVSRRPPGADLPGASSTRIASVLPDEGRFYLQTMVFGRNMIPLDQVDVPTPRGTPTRGISRSCERQFPGSGFRFGEEQSSTAPQPGLPPRVEQRRPPRLHRDDRPVEQGIGARSLRQDPAEAPAGSPLAHQRGFPPRVHLGCERQQVCFERELLDHRRLVFEKR